MRSLPTIPKIVAALAIVGCLIIGAAAGPSLSGGGATDSSPIQLSLYNPNVVVLKSTRLLYLFDGDRLIRTYPVKLGTAPLGQKNRAADGRTPEGRFFITSKNALSPYTRFLGISYPDRAAVERGLDAGLVSRGEAAAIVEAIESGRCPSWTTGLGGGIGLHGSADNLTATAGCIALSDGHIRELFNVLRLGDPVEILP